MANLDPAVVTAIRTFMCDRYAAAFSAKSPARVLECYKRRAVLTFHQLGGDRSGKGGTGGDVSAYTGGVLAAIVRGRLPGAIMLRVVFKRLAKRGYTRSTIRLLGVKATNDGAVLARVEFERFDASGVMFERSEAVYRVERAAQDWCIAEAWLYDEASQANALGLDSFTPL